ESIVPDDDVPERKHLRRRDFRRAARSLSLPIRHQFGGQCSGAHGRCQSWRASEFSISQIWLRPFPATGNWYVSAIPVGSLESPVAAESSSSAHRYLSLASEAGGAEDYIYYQFASFR